MQRLKIRIPDRRLHHNGPGAAGECVPPGPQGVAHFAARRGPRVTRRLSVASRWSRMTRRQTRPRMTGLSPKIHAFCEKNCVCNSLFFNKDLMLLAGTQALNQIPATHRKQRVKTKSRRDKIAPFPMQPGSSLDDRRFMQREESKILYHHPQDTRLIVGRRGYARAISSILASGILETTEGLLVSKILRLLGMRNCRPRAEDKV